MTSRQITLREYNKVCPVEGLRIADFPLDWYDKGYISQDFINREYTITYKGETFNVLGCEFHSLKDFECVYPNAEINWSLSYPICDGCGCPTPIKDLVAKYGSTELLCDDC